MRHVPAEDRKRLIEQTVATYGPVDILVNNAAVTYFIPINQFPEKRMRLMWDVQVFGPIETFADGLPRA